MSVLSKKWPLLRIMLIGGCLLLVLAAGTLYWLSRNLTHLVEAGLRKGLGPDVALGSIETGWNRVVVRELRLKRTGPGPFNDRIRIERVELTPSFRALFSRKLEIGRLRIERPHLLVEIAPDGKLIAPLPVVSSNNASTAKNPAKPAFTLRIDQVELLDGELTILDRQTKRRGLPGLSNPREGYHVVRFSQVALKTGRLGYPLAQEALPLKLALTAPQNGSLTLNGTIDPVSLDSALKLSLRQWDITKFRPYYLKPGDIDVTHGTLDGDATIAINGRKLHAPGEIKIKGLQLNLSGGRGMFLGLPAAAVLGFMKNNKDEIAVPFTLSGDLSNPRFQVRQSLVDQIATGVAGKIGIPVVSDVARGIIFLGGKGVEGIGKLFGK